MRKIPESSITDNEDKLTTDQESSFLDKVHEPVLIGEGDSLWRFISQKNKNKFSDFWIDSVTMGRIMRVFNGDYSEKMKKDTIRDNLAILQSWSKLSWRIKITLKQDMIAYKGITCRQKEFSDKDAVEHFGIKAVKLMDSRVGGHTQYVIPRFKGISDEKAKEYATVTYFAHI